jgi:hypothetical protein
MAILLHYFIVPSSQEFFTVLVYHGRDIHLLSQSKSLAYFLHLS